MVIELILAGNGPGELAGWIAPVAQAARTRTTSRDLRLTLILTPSQFASGREGEVAQRWSLFDRVIDARTATTVALGARTLDHAPNAALVHLGGDLWFSARLAKRMGIPAAAIAETSLIASRHRPFARVFAVSDGVAEELRRRGVPAEKIVVTGDPRRDALPPRDAPQPLDAHVPAGGLVTLMPGSRDRVFELIAPDFLKVAEALRTMARGTRFQVITSEFLSPSVIEAVRERARREWPGLPVDWKAAGEWEAIASSDFILTIPGTNTLELAMLGVPFAVVADLAWADRAPLEGTLEWLARIPVLGRAVRRAVLTRYLARRPLVALPNIRVGREVVPEWIGRWAPEDLAKRVEELLRDRPRREALRATLWSHFGGRGGAAGRIVEHAVMLAETGSRT